MVACNVLMTGVRGPDVTYAFFFTSSYAEVKRLRM